MRCSRAGRLRGVLDDQIDYGCETAQAAFVAGVREAFDKLDPDRDDDRDVISAADFVEIVGDLIAKMPS